MTTTIQKRTALVAGATGLVGKACLKAIEENPDYEKVLVLTRRALSEAYSSKVEILVTDFDRIEEFQEKLKCDDVYCALGTTIAAAGSRSAFHRVDVEYPLLIARLALKNGAKRFLLVSALGADRQSLFFYNREKGTVENELRQLGFDTLLIFRPSILLGKREEKRHAEAWGQKAVSKLSFLFVGALKKYRGTPAEALAKAMVKAAWHVRERVRIIENDELLELAHE